MDWNEDGKKDVLIGDSLGGLAVYLNVGTNATPRLGAREPIRVGDVVFSEKMLDDRFGKTHRYVSPRIKPDVTDWNEDGKKDIVIGTEGGYVFVLLNTGTNGAPAFADLDYLRVGEKRLPMASRGLARPCPKIFDWDRDGKKDLLIADEFGKMILYRNRGTNAAPSYSDFEILRAEGPPSVASYSARARVDLDGEAGTEYVSLNNHGEISIYFGRNRVKATAGGKPFKAPAGRNHNLAAADWDGDGKIDLLLGHPDGRVQWLRNPGVTASKPDFHPPRDILDAGKPLAGGKNVLVEVVDVNGDGKPDLRLTDATCVVRVFENLGTRRAPAFRGHRKIEIANSPIHIGPRMRVDVADWNGDGEPDLIVGSSLRTRKVYVYLARPERESD